MAAGAAVVAGEVGLGEAGDVVELGLERLASPLPERQLLGGQATYRLLGPRQHWNEQGGCEQKYRT